MKPKDFVVQLRTVVVDENVAIYRDLFVNTPVETATDPYWKRALTFFNALSPEQQAVFFEVMRQVAVDTTSNVLGVIDGVNTLGDMDTELALISSDDQLTLSGDLQSLFLVEGVVSWNRRNFRHPISKSATSASRSINFPLLWKV